MTRGNLNFVWQNTGESPRTLFHYQNGDQYPEGLLCFYGIEEFLSISHPWTPDDFREWIAKNYRVAGRKVVQGPNGMSVDMHCETEEPAVPEDLGENGQPRIYYTEGFITDYSYVFTVNPFKRGRASNRVIAWNWDRRIFAGSARSFLRFCRKKAEARQLAPLPQHSEQAIKEQVLNKMLGQLPS